MTKISFDFIISDERQKFTSNLLEKLDIWRVSIHSRISWTWETNEIVDMEWVERWKKRMIWQVVDWYEIVWVENVFIIPN